jgi:S1-C subfamily serine protease
MRPDRLSAIAAVSWSLASSLTHAQGDNSEAVFKRALAYTVQIKNAVPLPFDGDSKGVGQGSGFVVDRAQGWVLTNAHVVSRSPSRLEVAFHKGEFQEARKLYVDPFLDVALVDVGKRALADNVEDAPLDCGESPSVGHPVGAFGHPWGLKFTGTRGIVSGVTSRQDQELLQTDAPINPGNSGGPLISFVTGKVVGINTAAVALSQNSNFAVAMRYVCRVLDTLRAGKDPSPPELPLVYFKDIDEKNVLRVAKTYMAPGLIDIRPGDVIKAVEGVPGKIDNETQLVDKLRGRLDAVAMVVERNGEEVTVRGRFNPARRVLERTGTYVSGILFGPVALRDAREIGVSPVTVHYVEPGSPGQFAELRRADFLEAVDGQPVSGHEALYGLLREAERAKRPVTLKLRRIEGGKGIFTYIERRLKVTRLELVNGDSPP